MNVMDTTLHPLPMGPVPVLATITFLNGVTPEVVNFCGVLFGNLVICTVVGQKWNLRILESYIIYKGANNKRYKISCTTKWKMTIPKLREALSSFYNIPQGTTKSEIYSRIVVLHFDNGHVIGGAALREGRKISPGDLICAEDPCSQESINHATYNGIVSYVYGSNNMIFITDIHSSSLCVGVPVFRIYGDEKQLVGINLGGIPYSDGAQLRNSGLSLTINISIFKNLLACCCSCMNIMLPIANTNSTPLIRTDFMVTLECQESQGSGFIIHESGLIMTCAHVVKFTTGVTVNVKHGSMSYPARTIFCPSRNDRFDFAILEIINSSHQLFPKCSLSSMMPTQNERVYAFGAVTMYNRFLPIVSTGFIIRCNSWQIMSSSLTFNGSSGGAIVNSNNEALGIITSIICLEDVCFPFRNMNLCLHFLKPSISEFITTRDADQLERSIQRFNSSFSSL